MIDDNSKEFIKRHIGPSEEDQSKMLQYVGYKSLEDLMNNTCLLYTSPSPRDRQKSRMPSSA